MSFSPRPCPHCNGMSFQVIPGMQLDVHASPAMYGIAPAMLMFKNKRWTFTLVSCTQCGRSETFTTDAATLASACPNAQIVTTNRTS